MMIMQTIAIISAVAAVLALALTATNAFWPK
jgi:hypothetical protein